MKTYIFILSLFLWWGTHTTANAALPVTDAGHIATTLQTAKRDLLEQLLQGSTQSHQLETLIAQIRQADDLLKRMGKLEEVKDLPGFKREAEAFLRQLELNLPSNEIVNDIRDEELFEDDNNSPYEPIKRDIVIHGKKVAEVDAQTTRPQLAARRTIKQYHHIRAQVLARRSMLKDDLADTMDRLKTASTSAEVQKLTAVLNGLQIQIAATDSELSFAANEIIARRHQNEIEAQIQQQIQLQRDRAGLKDGMSKHLEQFVLPSSPILFQERNR